MSTAIKYALNDVHQRIPREILNTVFTPSTKYGISRLQFTNISVDTVIRNEVIERRIRPDIDTYGVQEETISLDGLERETVEENITPSFVVHIPKSRTGDRSITQVLSAVVNPLGFGLGSNRMSAFSQNNGGCKPSQFLQIAQELVNSNGSAMINQTIDVSLIGENTVLIRGTGAHQGKLGLRCLLTSDSEFSNLKRSSWRIFSELVVLATKAYIYNNYIIQMDQNELIGGSPIGMFKTIVEGYSDADQMYLERRTEVLGKLLIMNDDNRMDRFVRGLTGGRFR